MTLTSESEVFASMRDAFVARVAQSCLGIFDIVTMYLGDQPGLYRASADHGLPLLAGSLS